MKRILTFALMALLAGLTITAQTARTAQTSSTKKTKANVTGFIKDSETADVLVRAAVQIMTEDTASMVAGGVTNTLGGYTIKSVEEGTYIVKVSYLGYHNFYRKITIKNGETIHNVGTVLLIPNSILLGTAVVEGTVPQMEVKEDTIIFNADAFKVPEGSVLEDLVKKLPGAEVDSDGTIKINGKTINKILVNGKEFFSNDKDMAMKNIPTEIIDKIKTYDKASDQERLTGIADGNEETVIDLTLKKGMNKGMMGNVNLGIGTEEQYRTSLNLNRFVDDTFQQSIIANGNSNPNNGGRSKSGQVGLNITSSQRDKYEIGGNVRYNSSNSHSESRSASENYLLTTNPTYSDRISASRNHNDQANGDIRVEVKLDTATTFLLRGSGGFGKSGNGSEGLNATYNASPYNYDELSNPLRQWTDVERLLNGEIVNHNTSGSHSASNSHNASANWTLNRRFYNKQGRNFSLNGSFNYSHSNSDNFNLTDVHYYQRQTLPSDLIYRFRTSPNNSKSFSVGFTYSEPLAANLILQTTYSYNYSYRKNNSDTYNLGLHPDIQAMKDTIASMLGYLPTDYYTYIDDSLSNYNTSRNGDQNINLQLRWNNNFITSSVGVQMQPQHQRLQMNYMGKDIDTTRNFFRISPTVQFRYRFNRQNQINFSYRGSMSQPSITDMIDMTDDSNPLSIKKGNPYLKNSFQNNFSLGWQNYITATMQSYNINLSFSNTINSIGNKTTYNPEDGSSIRQPMNINGNWNASANITFSTPLFSNERLTLNTSSSVRYNNNKGFLSQQRKDEDGNPVYYTELGGTTIDRNQAKIGLNGRPIGVYDEYENQTNNLNVGENLRIGYRAEYFDVQARGSFSYQHQKNKYIKVSNPNTFNFSYGLETTGNFDNGWGYSTDIQMSSRRGYASKEANTNELIWNAQVSYRFLKGRAATLSLRWNDILNNRSNFSRRVSDTQTTDTWNKTVTSYVMATFIYRFRLFGTASQRREIRQERQERETYRANMEQSQGQQAGQGGQGGQGGARGNAGGGGNMGGGARGGGNMGGGGRF